ncbi:MAG: hypothetical protein AB7V46_23550 [Thermomicrobiales bacterium]
MKWDWSQLVDARVDDGQVAIGVGPIVWIGIVVVALAWVAWQRPWRLFGCGWEVQEITPNLFGTQWRISRNRRTAQLAHEAYVELITRKAAIPYEEGHDVIVEIYDSWYTLFTEIRRLARELPADALVRDKDLRRLHDLLITVLNQALRPHLTEWQSRFRHWYAGARRAGTDESPQEIQRRIPEYERLVEGLKDANQTLITLGEELRKLAHGATS